MKRNACCLPIEVYLNRSGFGKEARARIHSFLYLSALLDKYNEAWRTLSCNKELKTEGKTLVEMEDCNICNGTNHPESDFGTLI